MLKLAKYKTSFSRNCASMNEGDQAKMTVSLKVDQKTKMGIITDVKNALRKSYALKINYSSTKRGEK